MKKALIEGFVTGLWIGKVPWAPGTFGTLLGLPVAWLFYRGGPIFYMIATLFLIPFAIMAAEAYEAVHGEHDSSEIVIDEVIGFLIAMTWLPLTWQAFLAAFVIFRVFDIVKPFPISYLDKRVGGGIGTIIDDVVAGVFSNIVLQVIYTRTSWLGETLHGPAAG